MATVFEPGVTYKLINKYGTRFTGKLIDRDYGLGPALSGKDGNGNMCHLPLTSIENEKLKWRVIDALPI